MPTSVQSAGTPGRRLGAPKRGVRRIEKRTQGKGPTKASKKRPEWDWSSKDLSAHKLSKEELEHRHVSHLSKNLELAKHELYDKAKRSGGELLGKDVSQISSPLTSGGPARAKMARRRVDTRRLLTLQRSLHDRELHDVLARSDESMRVVRDLFGDDPKRYPCQPNVTVAPTLKQKLKTELNSRERVEELSQQLQQSELREGVPAVTAMDSPGGIWDESVRELMTQKKPALNDSTAIQGQAEEVGVVSPIADQKTAKSARVADLSSIDGSSEAASTGGYKPRTVDLRRFQQLLEQEENSHAVARKGHQAPHQPPGGASSGGQGMKAVPAPQVTSEGRGRSMGGGHASETTEKSSCAPAGHVLKSEKRSAWCDDSVGSSVRGEDFLVSEKVYNLRPANTVVANELSAVPLEPSVKTSVGSASTMASRGETRELSSEATHLGAAAAGTGVDLLPGASSKRQLENELLAQQNGGKVADVGAEVAGDGSMISRSTSRIHADLSRLEQLVHDLDHKLEASKKFFPDYSASFQLPTKPEQQQQQQQKQHQQQQQQQQHQQQQHQQLQQLFGQQSEHSPGVLGSVKGTPSLMTSVSQQLERSERQLEGEMLLRGQFLQTLADQQDLLDAMAAELLKVQRENELLRRDLVQVKTSTTEEVARLQDEVVNLHNAVFLLLQPRPHSPRELVGKHTGAGALQDDLQQSAAISKLKREALENPRGEQVSSNSLNSVAEPKLDIHKRASENSDVSGAPALPLSQSWVELTPRLDYVASAKDLRKKSLNRRGQDGGLTSGRASDKMQESVVYARVSPLTYSDNRLAGGGTGSSGSKSLPSLPVVPDVSMVDSCLSSLSTPQIGGVVVPSLLPSHEQSDRSLVFCAPAPPPIHKAVLPPVIPQPRVTAAVVSNRPKASSTHGGVGAPISRSKGHHNLLQPNPVVLTEADPVSSVVASEAERNHFNIAGNPSAVATSSSAVTSSNSVQISGGPVADSSAAQISQSHHLLGPEDTNILSSSGFDVAGLLQSLQQLQDLQMQAQGGGAGARVGANSSCLTGHGSLDLGASDNLISQEQSVAASESNQQQLGMQEPAGIRRRGSGLLLSSAGKSAANSRGVEHFELLTPISEETSLLLSTTKEDEESESRDVAGLPVADVQNTLSRNSAQLADHPGPSHQEVGKGSTVVGGLGLMPGWHTGKSFHSSDPGDKMDDSAAPQEAEKFLPHKHHGEVAIPTEDNAIKLRGHPPGGKKVQVQSASGRRDKESHHPLNTWFSLASHIAQQ